MLCYEGKKTYLEVQDDVPNKIKNNGGDAVGNTRGINPQQIHLRDGGRVRHNQAKWI